MMLAATYWEWTLAVLLIVANAATVVLVLLQLPGTWIMLALTALFTWWRWDAADLRISLWTLGAALVLALIAELIEFFAGSMGSRNAGGSKRGAAGSLIGGIAGAILGSIFIPIPILGTILGACLGSAIGSMLGDLWAGRTFEASLEAGKGAAVGRLVGTIAKVGVAALMWLVITLAMVF